MKGRIVAGLLLAGLFFGSMFVAKFGNPITAVRYFFGPGYHEYRGFFDIDIAALDTAGLGGTMTLRVTVVTPHAIPDAWVYVELDPGLISVSPIPTSLLDLKPNQPQYVDVTVRLAAAGDQRIRVSAGGSSAPSSFEVRYLYVRKYGADSLREP